MPILALAATYFFFLEYLPPLRRVHVPFDLAGYHYSLNDYAFQAVRHGRLPQWDPTIACGLSFAGNAQAATFYPPMWLLYAANLGRPRLSYLTLEIFVFLHVWLAFVLCHAWLKRRKLEPVACLLGAGVFAFSGYAMLQLQHLGLVCAYAWLPLALRGVDESVELASWRPLWKVTAASALAFLAGYPPTWAVLAVCVLAYAVVRPRPSWRNVLGVIYALGLSGLLAAVQLLPSWEASGLADHQPHYGGGIRGLRFYLSYVVPNYFDFGIRTPVHTNAGYEYLYLGAAACLGAACVVFRRDWRRCLPLWGLLGVSAIVVMNPFNRVAALVGGSAWTADLFRSWYFLAGITAALAPLSAEGIDAFLRKRTARFSAPAAVAVVTLGAAWCGWQVFALRGALPAGWGSLAPVLLTVCLLTAALWLYRGAFGAWRAALAAAILLLAGADYKVWGTSLRVNAEAGDLDRFNRQLGTFRGMSEENFAEVRSHREYRVVSDLGNSFWMEFRHFGLATPQGGDPLMPRPYFPVLGTAPGDAATDIDATARKDLLRLLGVRYVLTSENGLRPAQLAADPDFRLLPGAAYWKVYEFRGAQLPYRWERGEEAGNVARVAWEAERRAFDVRSKAGGRFVLVEQFYPGWRAWVDGRPAAISRWGQAFQAIDVPAGAHRIVFHFHSRLLPAGAAVSLLSLIGLVLALRLQRS